jgi:hypothetical protein
VLPTGVIANPDFKPTQTSLLSERTQRRSPPPAVGPSSGVLLAHLTDDNDDVRL